DVDDLLHRLEEERVAAGDVGAGRIFASEVRIDPEEGPGAAADQRPEVVERGDAAEVLDQLVQAGLEGPRDLTGGGAVGAPSVLRVAHEDRPEREDADAVDV